MTDILTGVMVKAAVISLVKHKIKLQTMNPHWLYSKYKNCLHSSLCLQSVSYDDNNNVNNDVDNENDSSNTNTKVDTNINTIIITITANNNYAAAATDDDGDNENNFSKSPYPHYYHQSYCYYFLEALLLILILTQLLTITAVDLESNIITSTAEDTAKIILTKIMFLIKL